jgi:hypothetical protein
MRLVCSFILPASLRPPDLADRLQQMLTLHAGVLVFVEQAPRSSDGGESLRVLVGRQNDIATVKTAIETNRADWQSAGITEIRPAA